MPYRVRISDRAERQLDKAVRWYSDHDPAVGAEWLAGFRTALKSLSRNPERCGLARETDRFPFDLRELLYGSGRRITHRALFYIEGNEVHVVGVRHVAQDEFTPDQL